jgi:hypothetical protein
MKITASSVCGQFHKYELVTGIQDTKTVFCGTFPALPHRLTFERTSADNSIQIRVIFPTGRLHVDLAPDDVQERWFTKTILRYAIPSEDRTDSLEKCQNRIPELDIRYVWYYRQPLVEAESYSEGV